MRWARYVYQVDQCCCNIEVASAAPSCWHKVYSSTIPRDWSTLSKIEGVIHGSRTPQPPKLTISLLGLSCQGVQWTYLRWLVDIHNRHMYVFSVVQHRLEQAAQQQASIHATNLQTSWYWARHSINWEDECSWLIKRATGRKKECTPYWRNCRKNLSGISQGEVVSPDRGPGETIDWR